MECKVFPAKVKAQCNAELRKELDVISGKRAEIESRIPPSNKKIWTLGGTFGAIGAFFGFVNAFLSCDDVGGPMFSGLFFGFLAGAAIGFLYNYFSPQRKNAMTPEERAAALAELDKEEEAAKKKATNRYMTYATEFSKQVDTVQMQLSMGETPEKYATALLPNLERFIANIDRSSHLKDLDAEFLFYINEKEIMVPWKDGKDDHYSFEVNRHADLRDAVQVAAVGKLVANNMRSLLTLKNPLDVSGTEYFLNYDVEYQEDRMMVKMKYTAPNGYYVTVTGW